MVELIEDLLNEYFSDFKKYQVFILIAFSLIIAGFQIFQSIWVSRTIEKFKAIIKKNEIKFSRYHNMQVDALKSIYTKLVLFHKANSILFSFENHSEKPQKFETSINIWIKTYLDCINEFSLEKILLPNNIKELVQRTVLDFEIVKEILIISRRNFKSLDQDIDEIGIDLYEYQEREINIISKTINELVLENKMETSEKNIKELRKVIEDYFEEMNK